MRSLVTGGAGFIGSHVARHLLDAGDEVVVLDDLSGGFRDHVPAGAHFVEGSILDDCLVDDLFEEHRFQHVFHLAAYAAEGLSHYIRRFNYSQNVVGSVNLINASVKHEVDCFVFGSSIAVYGRAPVPMTEEATPHPIDPYGIAKYAVELDLQAAQETFGLNYVIVRPHNVYGDHQNIGDRYRNVVGIFMNQVMKGRPMTVFGDGSQTRAFTYIDDVAPYIARCAQTPKSHGQIINIGSDTPYSVLEVAEAVGQAFGQTACIEHLPLRANEPVHAYSTHDKMRRLFGSKTATTLDQGIARMAEWAKTVGPRKSGRFSAIEIEENLPESWRIKAESKAR
jgi:UDP-glucose 4-epimerase